MNYNKWWGYLHVNGSLQVKIYFDQLDITEAQESPFCEQVAGPWVCENREAALKRLAWAVGLWYKKSEIVNET